MGTRDLGTRAPATQKVGFRFEGHIHRQRTTNMKKLYKDFEMSKEVALLSDEQELAAEIVNLQQTKDEQAECLDFVRNCTIGCEPYDDKERHRVGLRNSLKISF